MGGKKTFFVFGLLVVCACFALFFVYGGNGNIVEHPNYLEETTIQEEDIPPSFNQELDPEEEISIIIEFKSSPMVTSETKTPDDYKKEMVKDHKDLLYDWYKPWTWDEKHEIENEYFFLMDGISTTTKRKNIDKIKDLPNVKNVWEDEILTIHLQDSVPLINADDVWEIQNASGSNITGEGIIVAVLDTGIAYNHSDIEPTCDPATFVAGNCNKTIYGWDFVNDDNDPYDDHGHGTHCAGIVGANGSLKGVAPDVTLLAYKVLGSSGSGLSSGIISAIENATLYGADVISMSLGGSGGADNVYTTVINNAVGNGTVVVISAGNSGRGEAYYTIGSPGSTPSALTVGATNKEDVIADFSSRGFSMYTNYTIAGIKPDVVAPGVSINSTVPTGNCNHCTPSGYKSLSGTSMSAPHISGVVALLKQAHPDWNATELKSAVSNPSIDLGYDANTQGSGRVDVMKSYNLSGIIIPNNVFLGLDQQEEGTTWNSTKQLEIRNMQPYTISFSLNISFNETTNISVALNNYSITLGGNDSAFFNLTMEVNNSGIPMEIYYGDIIINSSDGRNSTVPFASYIAISPTGCPSIETVVTSDLTLNTTECNIPTFGTYIFDMNAENITLDCNNSIFNGGSEFGSRVVQSGKYNVTIKNCEINDYYWGAYLGGDARFNNVTNNTFSGNKYGVRIYRLNSSDTTIEKNNIEIEEGGTSNQEGVSTYLSTVTIQDNNIQLYEEGQGIAVWWQGDNIIKNNNITAMSAAGTDKIGVYIQGDENSNNYIVNNTLSVDGGVRILYSSSNIIENNNLTSNFYNFETHRCTENIFTGNNLMKEAQYGYRAYTSSINNIIKDMNLSSSEASVYLAYGSSVILTNITGYSESSIQDEISNVTRKWYLTINATDENFNLLQDVNVSVYENTTGSWVLDWSQLTDSDGIVLNEPSIQYIENETGKTYYDLNISVTKPGYYSNETTLSNLSENTPISLILESGAPDSTPPIVTLSLPSNQLLTNLTNITFECNTTDDLSLKNVSLYGNWTGTWHLNQTINISGVSNSTQFNVTNLSNGTYEWNCLAYDNDNSVFADSNWTFKVNTSYIPPEEIPNVTIISPINNSYFDIQNVTLNFTVTDGQDENLTCWYDLDGDIVNLTNPDPLVNRTIILQEADTENLDDASINDTAGDNDFWNYIGNSVSTKTGVWRYFIKFNISSLEDFNITNSSLFIYKYGWAGDSTIYIDAYGSDSNWTEETINGTNFPFNYSKESSFYSSSAAGWYDWNVFNWTENRTDEGENNVSFMLRKRDESNLGRIQIYSKEYSTPSLRPYLNITYLRTPNSTYISNGSYNTLNFTNLIEGEHNISVICEDSVPQNGTSDNHTFYIDLTNPVMDIPTPANGTIVNGSSEENFNIFVNDNIALNTSSGILYWRYPSGEQFTEEEMFCSLSFCDVNLDLSGISVGEEIDYYFEIEDLAGNTGNNGTSINILTATICTELLVNTSWSSWQNTSRCFLNNTRNQNRSRVGYDSNNCGIYSNVTYWESQTIACTQDSLVCYIALNENSGTTAHDLSGNSNDGTISGATWNNDGINITIFQNTNYILNGAIFTIIDDTLSWTEIIAVYSFSERDNSGLGIEATIDAILTLPRLLALLVLVVMIGIILFIIFRMDGTSQT